MNLHSPSSAFARSFFVKLSLEATGEVINSRKRWEKMRASRGHSLKYHR